MRGCLCCCDYFVFFSVHILSWQRRLHQNRPDGGGLQLRSPWIQGLLSDWDVCEHQKRTLFSPMMLHLFLKSSVNMSDVDTLLLCGACLTRQMWRNSWCDSQKILCSAHVKGASQCHTWIVNHMHSAFIPNNLHFTTLSPVAVSSVVLPPWSPSAWDPIAPFSLQPKQIIKSSPAHLGLTNVITLINMTSLAIWTWFVISHCAPLCSGGKRCYNVQQLTNYSWLPQHLRNRLKHTCTYLCIMCCMNVESCPTSCASHLGYTYSPPTSSFTWQHSWNKTSTATTDHPSAAWVWWVWQFQHQQYNNNQTFSLSSCRAGLYFRCATMRVTYSEVHGVLLRE